MDRRPYRRRAMCRLPVCRRLLVLQATEEAEACCIRRRERRGEQRERGFSKGTTTFGLCSTPTANGARRLVSCSHA
ncbi:hypothetical protein CKAH01_00434 [Colletotrichum kahawae]|uniref:Uncharacterized protein n=1 Tax=Colletotrichum kahawae TaxID=34407 RepID=A0AAE0DEK4_COLKA|nr:hypothetical protein CKAH01_00434 [Colletotrichum kahawae]